MRLPPIQMANTLVEAFFAFSGTTFPILDRLPFQDLVHYSYQSPGAVAEERLYVVCMVFAIGCGALEAAGIMEQHDRALYYGQAQQYASKVINKRDLDCIEALLLECLHTFFNPNGQSLWNLVSLAARQAIELGLHLEERIGTCGALRKERRTRLFWTVHTFDRLVSASLGRPPIFRESDIQRSPDWLPSIYSGGDHNDDVNCNFTSRHLRWLRQIQLEVSDTNFAAGLQASGPNSKAHFQEVAQKWLDSTPTLPSEAVVLLTSLHVFLYYEDCFHELQLMIGVPRAWSETPGALAWPAGALDTLIWHACRRLELFVSAAGTKIALTWIDLRSIFRTIVVLLWGCANETGVKVPPDTLLELCKAAAGQLDVVSARWNVAARIQEPLMLLCTTYLNLYLSENAARPSRRCDERIELLLLETRTYTRPHVDVPTLDSLVAGVVDPGLPANPAIATSAAEGGSAAVRQTSHTTNAAMLDPKLQAVVAVAKWHEEMMLKFA